MISRIKQIIQDLSGENQTTFLLLLEKVVIMLAAGVGSILLARIIGPETYGLMSYALAFVAMFSAFAGGAMNDILIRECVAARSRRAQILMAGISLNLILSLCLIPLILLVYRCFGNSSISLLAMLCASIAVMASVSGSVRSLLLSEHAIGIAVKWTIITLLLATGAKIWVGSAYHSLWGILLISSMQGVTLSLILLYLLRKKSPELVKWNLLLSQYGDIYSRIKKLLIEGTPRIIVVSITMIRNNIATVALATVITTTDLGQYSLAIKLFGFALFIPNALCRAAGPTVLKAYSGDFRDGDDKFVKVSRRVFYISVGVAIFCALVAFYLFDFLLGEEYTKVSSLFLLMICSLPLVAMGQMKIWYNLSKRLQVYSMWMTMFTGVINVSLILYLSSLYGALGAVGAYIGAQIIDVLLVDLTFRIPRNRVFLLFKSISLIEI